MNNEQLNRTLGLMRRTGDKAIILDQASEHVFVMMDIDDYEGLLDEADYLANPQITPSTISPVDDEDPLQDYVLDDVLPAQELEPTAADTAPSLTPEEYTETTIHPIQENTSTEAKNNTSNLNFGENWVESKPRAILSEESLVDVPNEEEEEKFYLEPVDEV